MKGRLLGLLFSLLSTGAYAEDASVGLSKRLLCYMSEVFVSPVGIMIGLVIALYGLWVIIREAKTGWGIALILMGAAVSALPSLVASFLSGTQQVVEGSGMANRAQRDVQSVYEEAFAYKGRCDSIIVDMSKYLQETLPGGPGTIGGSGGDRSLVSGAYGNDTITGCGEGGGVSSHVVNGTMTSCYGEQRATHRHGGLDIAGRIGDPIGSYADGEVIYADFSGGYGNHILVRHDDGTITSYGHLNGYNVSVGDRVTAGQQIGTLGNTGRSTGPHLDFEYRDANNNKLNPCLHTSMCGNR